jgi:hypothetical protein
MTYFVRWIIFYTFPFMSWHCNYLVIRVSASQSEEISGECTSLSFFSLPQGEQKQPGERLDSERQSKLLRSGVREQGLRERI